MTYLLFLIIAVVYNFRKFQKLKERILIDLNSSDEVRRHVILGHFFWVFVIEIYVGLAVAYSFSSEDDFIYAGTAFLLTTSLFLTVSLSYLIYQVFLNWVAKEVSSFSKKSFNKYLSKEFRISFSLGVLPILLYSVITKTFLDENDVSGMGLGILSNILFVSVLTITCTVIIMLKLIPNCEITEPEFLAIINKRLEEANLTSIRVRWIEAEFKNAFVVGLNFPFFKHQTMFIGRPLRSILDKEEFDAVICHEIAHIKQGHMAKRIMAGLWNIIRFTLGILVFGAAMYMAFYFIYGIEFYFYIPQLAELLFVMVVFTLIISYYFFFEAIRSQEFEADAISIMEFGCRIEALESALKKVMASDNPYIKPKKKNALVKLLSTHPTVEERVEMLHKKVNEGLPFDHKTPFPQKAATFLFSLFKIRYFAPLSLLFCLSVYYCINDSQSFSEKRIALAGLNDEELMKNAYLNESINDRPIFGHSNLYYVMIRKNPKLIDHFLSQGADPDKVVFYLASMDEEILAAQYVTKLEDKLSEEAYQRAVKLLHFKKLSPEAVAILEKSPRYRPKRMPASTTSNQPDNQ